MVGWITQFLAFVLGSGVVAALTQSFFDNRRTAKSKREAVSYLALRLAYLLEGYAIDCASKEADHDTAIEHEGDAGSFLAEVPVLPDLPTSDAYQLLDTKTLGQILDLPQRREMAQQAAMFWWDMVADEGATRVALGENTITMGFLALKIAKDLRSSYHLGSRDLTFGRWDIVQHYEKEMRKVAAAEAHREKMEAEGAAAAERDLAVITGQLSPSDDNHRSLATTPES
jgi:hypothetical protein